MVLRLLTVLVSEPLPGAVTVTVRLVESSAPRLKAVQVTVPPACDPPVEAEKKVLRAGSTSLTTMLLARVGPELSTVRV